MSRAVALACSVSLTACFSEPPSTDDGGSQGASSSDGETSATTDGSGTTVAPDATSAAAEVTSDSAGTVDDSSSSTDASDDSTGAEPEVVVLDLDVAVCDATWLDDFGETIPCPSVRTGAAAVRGVSESSVFVEALATEITEDAFVTQPRDGALAEVRGTFVLPSVQASTFLRGTVICEFATGCLSEIVIAVSPVSSGDVPRPISTTSLSSEDARGIALDLELPVVDEAAYLFVTVRADTAGAADTVVWLSPRLVLASP